MHARLVAAGSAATLLTLALAGCGSAAGPVVTVTETVTEQAQPVAQSSDQPSSDASTTPTEDSSLPDGAQARFGSAYSYDDGLIVTVSSASAYKPSQFAVCATSHAYVMYTITIKNSTGAAFDPSFFHTTVQSGQSEGDQCFDSSRGLGGSPSTKVLAGRSVTWKAGYGVANAKDVVMEVTPDFDHDSVIFAS